MSREDTRRPTMDLGLGVWTKTARIYYPLEVLRSHDGAVIDGFDEKRLLVYVEPASGVPTAIYTQATRCTRKENEMELDTGERIRDGRLYDSQGTAQTAEQPMQLFTRWYGFAYTFPGCEIYQEKSGNAL